jgi:hypothetical protein
MKKMMFVLLAALLTTGTLLAQGVDYPASIAGQKFNFDATRSVSTESRYSAGRFGSYVDDFVGVNDYNGKTRTFLFLGGYGSSDVSVDESEVPFAALSGGFAASLNSLYLGVYFSGNLINAQGWDNGLSDQGTIYSEAIWNNNIAVLVGNLPFGALRLDMAMDNATDSSRKVNEEKTEATGKGIMTSITWGMNNLGKLTNPHASLGIKWPDYTFSTDTPPVPPETDPITTTTETYKDTQLAIKAGVGLALNDASSLSLDAILQFGFGTKSTTKSPDSEVTESGDFATFIDAGYSTELIMSNQLAMRIKPKVTIALKLDDNDTETSPGTKYDAPLQTTFETKIGVDLGVQFKATPKFTFYTGASLNIFDWVAWGVSGGDPKRGGGSWQITGLKFDDNAMAGLDQSHLGFGLVFAPDEHISLSCGLNALLDRLFVFDLKNMQVRAGDLWGNLNDQGFIGGNAVWNNVRFDLTASYTF